MTFNPTAEMVYSDGPASAPSHPDKAEIRRLLAQYEAVMNAFTSNGGLIYISKSTLDADLSKSANTMAWVIGDTDIAFNGIYMKVGASGSGSWSRVGDLPYSFISAEAISSGTPSAIAAISSIPINASALILLKILETNDASPVTVSFNGGDVLTVKTNSRNDIVVGGLIAGMFVLGMMMDDEFRLINDQVSSAIVAAAEASAAAAAASASLASGYADFIRNNWVIAGPFTGTGSLSNYVLPINPGSANNMFPVISGVAQMVSDSSYSLVASGGSYYISINVPSGVSFEVRIGNKIDVNTPADGSVTTTKIADANVTAAKIADANVTTAKIADANVTTAKIADDNVTYAKMQNISATSRILGRVSAGAGDAEELTAAQLRDNFFPSGSIVASSLTLQATSAFGITSLIPTDNTIPQITEGTEIFSVSVTPKKTTNKLRATVTVRGSCTGVGAFVGALFSAGAANAIAAEVASTTGSGVVETMVITHEWTPAVTTAITVSVRLGVAAGYSGQTLTINQALFGGVNHCSLLLEEIAG